MLLFGIRQNFPFKRTVAAFRKREIKTLTCTDIKADFFAEWKFIRKQKPANRSMKSSPKARKIERGASKSRKYFDTISVCVCRRKQQISLIFWVHFDFPSSHLLEKLEVGLDAHAASNYYAENTKITIGKLAKLFRARASAIHCYFFKLLPH